MYKTDETLIACKEAEENIIAEIITDTDNAKYIDELNVEDFYYKTNQKIFELIKELKDKEQNIDLVSIRTIGINKKYNGQALLETVVSITDTLPFSCNIENTFRIIKSLSMRRKIQEVAKKIIKEAEQVDIEKDDLDVKNAAIQEFLNLKTTQKNEEKEMSDVMLETVQDIEKKYKKRDDYSYRTGYLDLDRIIEGLHEQELTIIAARPGVGKTSFALQMAEHIAKKNIYTYFVSLEMSEKQLGNRMIARKADIDSHVLRMGWLTEENFAEIGKAAGEISEFKMCIDSKVSTIQEIESKAMQLKNEKNLGLIVIDYLQLLKSKNKFSNREQEVADISRRLKLLTKKLDIPIVALCQLNRETEKRKTPILADLRESGSLEQDADNVIFLYIADDEKNKSKIINIDVIVAKQRNGPTGTVRIEFNKKQMKFENVGG
jgi:replicative DNA helicase